jgi:hypothetical protein
MPGGCRRTYTRQTLDILDASGNAMNTQSLTSSFGGGVYLVWNVTGNVKIRVTGDRRGQRGNQRAVF